jgi:hypothetical protein
MLHFSVSLLHIHVSYLCRLQCHSELGEYPFDAHDMDNVRKARTSLRQYEQTRSDR